MLTSDAQCRSCPSTDCLQNARIDELLAFEIARQGDRVRTLRTELILDICLGDLVDARKTLAKPTARTKEQEPSTEKEKVSNELVLQVLASEQIVLTDKTWALPLLLARCSGVRQNRGEAIDFQTG